MLWARAGCVAVVVVAGSLQVSAAKDVATPAGPDRAILVSRQLLEAEHLSVGDVVSLSADPSGAGAWPFRIGGVYEPIADPHRLGDPRLEARCHLPDLIDLTRDRSDPSSSEEVTAINVQLADPSDAAAFAREASARLPGHLVRETASPAGAIDPFVVLERFHLAIALVTVIASSVFLLALMVLLVDERHATVAILRLIGLRRRRIAFQVFAEGLVIAVIGAAFGVGLAAVLEGVFNRFFQWYYDTSLVFVRVTPPIVARSVLLAVPLGMFASIASCWSLLRRADFVNARP